MPKGSLEVAPSPQISFSTVARMSWARVAGAAGGAGPRGGGVEGVPVVCGTPALVVVVAGAGGGGIRDGVVR